jgi:dTDP-4-dehydrorhamnose reductase
MKILILGATGLAGQSVAAACATRGHDVKMAARHGAPLAVDITDDTGLKTLLSTENPDVLINCAASVDLDACERDSPAGWRVNAVPLATMSEWANSTDAFLIHISTDHYYRSGGAIAHDELCPIEFANDYARQKYAAEAFALNARRALVVRTSIVGHRRWPQPTFAEWIFDLIEHDRPATLFADAFTSSIDTRTFARALLDMIDANVTGLINLAASEVYSKLTFAQEVARQLDRTLSNQGVGSVSSLAVSRANCLGLDVTKAESTLGYKLPNLQEVVASLVREYKDMQHAL